MEKSRLSHLVSEQYTSRKWIDIPASGGNHQGEAQLAGHSRDLAGAKCPAHSAAVQEKEGIVR